MAIIIVVLCAFDHFKGITGPYSRKIDKKGVSNKVHLMAMKE